MEHQDYAHGFNHGYLLAKHLPDLSERIAMSMVPSSGYGEGYLHGTREFLLEKARLQLRNLIEIRERATHRFKDLGLD